MRPNPEGASRFTNQHLVGDDVVHPVVIRHPLSGRKSLYVNPAFTRHFEGWSADDSRPLLEYLYRHASRPEFSLPLPLARGLDRLLGQPGDLALRRQRLQRRAPADASRHRRRLRPATGDDVSLRYGLSLMVIAATPAARL